MAAEFDKSQWGAKKVWCEVWNGFIFINLSQERPTSVAEELRETDFSKYQLHKTKVIKDVELVFDCNWKLVAENFYECYHCAMNHPELCRTILPDASMEVVTPVEREDPTKSLMYAADATGSFKPGVRSMTMDGDYAVKRLLGDPSDPPSTLTQMAWYPAFQINGHADWFHTESWRPLGPNKTAFRATWTVHEEAVEGVDYILDDVVKVHTETLQEDKILMKTIRDGIASQFYTPGPLHPGLESGTMEFLSTYRATIAAYEAENK
jgi:Rieske 2Fe-2S family protein